MKKTILTFALILLVSQQVTGAGIGYIDYNEVVQNYSLSKQYKQQLDNQYDEYKKYVETQEKNAQNAKTSEEKKQIEKTAVKEINKMQLNYIKQKNQKEDIVRKNISKASEKVRIEKNLDIILRKDFTVSGGIDCTKEVSNKLK